MHALLSDEKGPSRTLIRDAERSSRILMKLIIVREELGVQEKDAKKRRIKKCY